MRTSILLSGALIILCLQIQATVRTVSNNPSSPAQFSDLQAAVDASVSGDTILVSGSNLTYGNITIDKPLTIFGQGHRPLTPGVPETQIQTISIESTSSNSKFEGLTIQRVVVIDAGGEINGLEFNRILFSGLTECLLTSGVPVTGFVMKNCLIIETRMNFQSSQVSGALILNNYFRNSSATGGTSNVTDMLFDHNLFSGSTFIATNSTVSNSIIIGPVQGANCNYINNISWNCGSSCDFTYIGSVGTGNIINTDPQLITSPSNAEVYGLDFNLDIGSPGINAANDGTDIGIFGGTTPFPDDFNYGGAPKLPWIDSVILLNAIVGQDGQLNIQATGGSGE